MVDVCLDASIYSTFQITIIVSSIHKIIQLVQFITYLYYVYKLNKDISDVGVFINQHCYGCIYLLE